MPPIPMPIQNDLFSSLQKKTVAFLISADYAIITHPFALPVISSNYFSCL